jgi:deazaflavin-dependent oxidoreductase (nitroreductase family)
MSDYNSTVVTEFRTNRGVVGGPFEGRHLLILHAVGRRTGQERLYPLLYLAEGDSLVICGSMGGAPKEPLWVANVEAMSEATVEVGERTMTVRPTVLREGAERDRLYALLVDYWPDFLEYEQKTTRVFPVIRLDPVG